MNKTDGRKALGRGLSALIPAAGNAPTPIRRDYFECAIEDVHPWDKNPRQTFNEQSLDELAETVRTQGLGQPLLVRQRAEGGWLLIAGERRWRAAQRAGLKQVRVVVREATDAQAFEMALVENIQRENLNAIEEAEAYHRLSSEFGYTQEQVAERVGKDRVSVSNALRLLKLPASVRSRVASGALSMGHARALLGAVGDVQSEGGAALIEKLAARVVAGGLSVRQVEALARSERKAPAKKVAAPPSASVRDLENRLQQTLGTKVRVVQKSAQAGHLEIDYHSLDQLDDILTKIRR